MLAQARRRILQELSEQALVLDVGGWAVPFPRADWMLDLGSYETRGQWGYEGEREHERFSADTWVQRDVCDREPWPFADGQFDFAICSHTLEDLRDPVWVCQELVRTARAGYIEGPSRLVEQAYGFQGPYAGYGHHHWLLDVDQDACAIDFVFKHHVVHAPEHRFAFGFYETLGEQQQVCSLWWEGSFSFRERMFDTPIELSDYLREFVESNGPVDPAVHGGRARSILRRLRG